jgi:hypothetical protein
MLINDAPERLDKMEEKVNSTKSSSGSDASKTRDFKLKTNDESDSMGFDSDIQSDGGFFEHLLNDES